MKIVGFTIIRNALLNDYPVVESIRSILPLVDEMLVTVGRSDDDTLALIQSIDSPKIRIVETVWDVSVREGGRVLALETDKAKALLPTDTDWAFYIQADEILHEQYIPAIRAACQTHLHDSTVEGLLFDYLHFYGTYRYVGDSRTWYRREVRIIRNDPAIWAYRDAQGFRKGKTKLRVKPSGACMYHYGWVKSPVRMKQKIKNVERFWKDDAEWQQTLRSDDFFDYDQFDSLRLFEGTHPSVLLDRIARQDWDISLDVSKKKFSLKDRLLYWFERKTGQRLFEFRNYRLLPD
jgi:uncharacterized protein (DUF427 family)